MDKDQRQVSKFFIGEEVERTICLGKKTLFVTGLIDSVEMIDAAKKHKCKHIYLGANQSFMAVNNSFLDWLDTIKVLLDNNFWVTLDSDVKYATELSTAYQGIIGHDKFVLMLSVKLPNIKNFNYNTTIKLDDTSWGATNAGVWVHQLQGCSGYFDEEP